MTSSGTPEGRLPLDDRTTWHVQLSVFALVSASFTNIYLTQPVLPVLQQEFAADLLLVSATVSAVILGMAISNLPFGWLADKAPIHPIILSGGLAVAASGLICAAADSLWLLITARFLQGLCIPALTTCLAAYLAKTLPLARLNVVMGSYVAATVLGGLGGRLLGGWIHPPLHWRTAFVSASLFMLLATLTALRVLPRNRSLAAVPRDSPDYLSLLRRWDLLRLYLCAAGSFAIFSSVFNYLPFRLHEAPFLFSTSETTMVYLVYVVGIGMGPTAGRLSNRMGSGTTMLLGVAALGMGLVLIQLTGIGAVIAGLLALCTGFFTVHAAAVGSLNRRLALGQGRANALYVLFYYAGGWAGITCAGLVYRAGGWHAVACAGLVVLFIPLTVGLAERRAGFGAREKHTPAD